MKEIIKTLQGLNEDYGNGIIESITINMNESKPELDEWFGTVNRNGNDRRMFKVVDGICTFLSRKRKVK